MKVPNFLSNSHFNTILPVYLTQDMEPNYVRERIITQDNDFIDFDWVSKDEEDNPTVILFHGTEGNSKSHYAKRIMYYLEQIGWRGVVPHFRGCSEEINRNLRFYHAGDTEDVSWIIQQIKNRTTSKLFACGVSIGGNMLLKYLGENRENSLIDKAIAISTPFDLLECAESLNNGFNKHVYVKHFLNTLLPKMKEYSKMFDNFQYIDRKIDTLDEFNNLYLCQVADFQDTYDYYKQASCKQFLKDIITPTMLLQAQNDPMIPMNCWPKREELSPYVRLVSTKNGGHAGFVTFNRNYKEALLKLPKFIVKYLSRLEQTITADIDDKLNIG
jgi:predicted alpha/beta-fold hydrolase